MLKCLTLAAAAGVAVHFFGPRVTAPNDTDPAVIKEIGECLERWNKPDLDYDWIVRTGYCQNTEWRNYRFRIGQPTQADRVYDLPTSVSRNSATTFPTTGSG